MFGDMFGDDALQRALEAFLGDNFSNVAGPSVQREAPRTAPTAEWNSSRLSQTLISHAEAMSFCASGPKSFDFSGFFPICARLEKLTREQQTELGRVAYVDRTDSAKTTIKFDETRTSAPGSIETLIETHNHNRVPVLTVQSHRPIPNPVSSYHFSQRELVSFLSHPTLQFSVIVAESLTLIVMRTASTPQFNTNVEDTIKALYKQYSATTSEPHRADREGNALIACNKQICRALNLQLYRVKHSDQYRIAKQINLDPS
jgi:hypothetical protein